MRRVFNWVQAAEMIKEFKPHVAAAGLRHCWEATSSVIYDGGPVTDGYTYLASDWAWPILWMDGEAYPCFTMDPKCPWDEKTRWPQEALDILEEKDGDDAGGVEQASGAVREDRPRAGREEG